MIEVKLEDIILKKTFGPIALGDSKETVTRFLGEPEKVSAPGVLIGDHEIIAYDWFEFTFQKNELTMFQHKHILIDDSDFNDEFHFQNDKFKVTSWFKNYKEDLKIEAIKTWLTGNGVNYFEEPYFDSIRFLIEDQIEIQFYSKLANHKDHSEWSKYSKQELNFQLGAFFVFNKKK